MELFVRKNKDDKISKEFYYLGRMTATGRTEEFVMANTDKTAVEIEWALDTPVREDIYEYISKSLMAEKAAENLINKIERNILRLETMPESCSIIEEFKERKKQYRKLIINNYVAIYRIDEENRKVYIIRIVYGGRNYLNEI